MPPTPLDVLWAMRQIRRHKLLSGVAVLLISLGIGTSTLIFSFVNGVLLKPLPIRDPYRFYQVLKNERQQVVPDDTFYTPEFQAIRNGASQVLATVDADSSLGLRPYIDGERTTMVDVDSVSPSFFSHLGLTPELGRFFGTDDLNSGVVTGIISFRFWSRSFDRQPVIGRTLRIGGVPITIIGVLPRSFFGITLDVEPDITVPLSSAHILTETSPQSQPMKIYVRLNPLISKAAAETVLQPLVKRTLEEAIQSMRPRPPMSVVKEFLDIRVSLESMAHGESRLREEVSNALLLLMVSGVGLLVIVCLNVGGLMLGTAQNRRKEVAIRRALGASTQQILKGVLIEALMIAILGAVLGVTLSIVASPLMLRLLPAIRDISTGVRFSASVDVTPDWRVLVFALVSTLLTVIIFSSGPALTASRVDLTLDLKDGSQHGGASFHRITSNLLLGAQTTFTAVLVITACLMLHTYSNLKGARTGLDIEHIVSFRLAPYAAGYKGVQLNRFFNQVQEAVSALPGVAGAGISVGDLMRGKGYGDTVVPTGQTLRANAFLNTSMNMVSPGYFNAMGLHVLAGRDLRADDEPINGQPEPVVVNEAFSHTFFANQFAIGHTFAHGVDGHVEPAFRIVGVVSDSKYRSLRESPPPIYYAVLHAPSLATLYVRTNATPSIVIGEVRKAVARVDSGVPILDISTMVEQVNESLWQERIVLTLTLMFGVIALGLAATGTYGVLTQKISQERRHIAIQLSLGAQPRHLVRSIAVPLLTAVCIAAAVGVMLSAVVLKVTAAFLYGVSPLDPMSYIVGAVGITVTALLTIIGPMKSAMRVEAASLLKGD